MKVENNFASFWIKNGILFFIYNEDVEITLLAAKQIVSDRLQLQKGHTYPVLCDIRGVKSIGMDARRYFATEGSVFITAMALLSDTPISHIFSELYVTANTPPIPTEIFNNETEALDYLSTFVS
ncbi:DUF7793 family protein [Confluentibacter sediminis]|uniref:DUF7793 family protein n=1 Tax=Confluentibacter sediminis TaxID=2219045 RepID=UPI000DAC94F2|nr:hypothetical protein [Confluentibacter sediminis]